MTRGLWGFRKNKIDKLAYSNSDSYPTGLGEDVKKFIKNNSVKKLGKIADRIILVSDNSKQAQELADVRPEDCTSDLCYMVDSKEFIKNSLFCEYAYIINLDTKKLEIYIGGQKKPQNNRYRIDKPLDNFTTYYNCKLLLKVSLSKVKDFSIEKFYNKLKEGYKRRG